MLSYDKWINQSPKKLDEIRNRVDSNYILPILSDKEKIFICANTPERWEVRAIFEPSKYDLIYFIDQLVGYTEVCFAEWEEGTLPTYNQMKRLQRK